MYLQPSMFVYIGCEGGRLIGRPNQQKYKEVKRPSFAFINAVGTIL